MTGLFPEHPILFYPSVAARYGTDEALLLALYHRYCEHHGHQDAEGHGYFITRRNEWRELASFWDEDRLAEVTNSLVSQGVIEAEFSANGSIRIGFVAVSPDSEAPVNTEAVATSPAKPHRQTQPTTSHKEPRLSPSQAGSSRGAATPAVVDAPFSRAEGLLPRGPAPSFGGSNGWRRPKDDLERLFEQQEKRNQQLHVMFAEWQPGGTCAQMLAKQNIPAEFAGDRVDEFVSYWIDKDRREASWDHLFIRYVKKEWVKEQSRQGRLVRQQQDSIEVKGERDQSNHRAERRQRITDAVMDIHNVDW